MITCGAVEMSSNCWPWSAPGGASAGAAVQVPPVPCNLGMLLSGLEMTRCRPGVACVGDGMRTLRDHGGRGHLVAPFSNRTAPVPWPLEEPFLQ